MTIPALAVSGAANALSSLMDAFKSHKKGHSRHETSATSQTDATGQNLPTGSAGQGGFDPALLMSKVDGDSSGSVSKDEFSSFLQSLDKSTGGLIGIQAQASGGTTQSVAASLFGKLDADGDGSLSQAELAAVNDGRGPPPPRANGSLADQLMASFDSNGDGAISKDEISAALDASRTQNERRKSMAGASQPSLEALALRAVQAYGRTLSQTGATTAATTAPTAASA
ncbi:EF-hand domain-containing protein [Alsobacter sp. KACC 23698]|uniref:EF-hand domain-containing protein n=1 Tax=Alsobacter sp. KACC 23698 TaxID=3149229 RepID=A0AAU7JAH5_9HYPH